MEKVDIIKHYNQLKKDLGHQPSSTEFYKKTGISRHAVQGSFGSSAWNKLVAECGDVPKEFSKEKSDFEEILIQYGNLFRELKKHPVESEWQFRKYTPTVNGITKSHEIKWIEMPQKFLDFAYGKIEWQDVIDLIPNNNSTTQIESNNYTEKLSPQLNNYIPPIIQDLIDLSYNENKFTEFEKKVNTAFEMLGFEVKHLGQGTGRKPDGIAMYKTNPRYAILIDF